MRAKYAVAKPSGNSLQPTVAARPTAVSPVSTQAVPPVSRLALQNSSYEIDNPHRLIRATAKGSRGLRPNRCATEPLLVTAGEGRLNLKVGPESLKRALWTMDGLIKRFESAHLQVSVKDRSTLVEQNGQAVSVRIREGIQRLDVPAEQRKNSWDSRYTWRPNGVLNFEILGNYRAVRKYSDSVQSPLDQKGDRIVAAIIDLLDERRREAEQKRIEDIFRQYDARQEARRERQRAELQKRAESLMNDVEAWHRSRQVREYLAAFRATVEKWSGPIDPRTELGKWLDWATRYADSLDPLNPSAN